jgi:hypothetical protein
MHGPVNQIHVEYERSIDEWQLVTTGRTCVARSWLYTSGTGTFVALNVADMWQTST